MSSCYSSPNPEAIGPPLVDYSRLLIHYIHSYPPYLEAVSSIRNPRTCFIVVMGAHWEICVQFDVKQLQLW